MPPSKRMQLHILSGAIFAIDDKIMSIITYRLGAIPP